MRKLWTPRRVQITPSGFYLRCPLPFFRMKWHLAIQDRHALLDNECESGGSYFFRDFGQSGGGAPNTGDPWVLWDIGGQLGIIWLRTQTLELAGPGL